MRTRTVRLGVLAVTGVLLIGAAYGIYRYHPFRVRVQSMPAAQAQNSEPLFEKSVPSPDLSRNDLTPSPLSAFRSSLLQCFGEELDAWGLEKATDIANLIQALEGSGISRSERIFETYRYRLVDGSEQHLHLFFQPNEAHVEMRLYGFDVRGMPIPLPLPPEDSTDPTPETIQNYLSEGFLLSHEVQLETHYGNGVVARIEELNDLPIGIRARAPGGSFFCKGVNCACE